MLTLAMVQEVPISVDVLRIARKSTRQTDNGDIIRRALFYTNHAVSSDYSDYYRVCDENKDSVRKKLTMQGRCTTVLLSVTECHSNYHEVRPYCTQRRLSRDLGEVDQMDPD